MNIINFFWSQTSIKCLVSISPNIIFLFNFNFPIIIVIIIIVSGDFKKNCFGTED